MDVVSSNNDKISEIPLHSWIYQNLLKATFFNNSCVDESTSGCYEIDINCASELRGILETRRLISFKVSLINSWIDLNFFKIAKTNSEARFWQRNTNVLPFGSQSPLLNVNGLFLCWNICKIVICYVYIGDTILNSQILLNLLSIPKTQSDA